MFHIYQKNGAWKLKGNEDLFFTTQEEAIQVTAQIGGQMGLKEFEVFVETMEPAPPSPYEQILGFQICERCRVHPCEC
jgi:hypothetical protein